MTLFIPKEQAIKILKERRDEVSSFNFNHKVWKARTLLDLKQIFGTLSDQWVQVSAIHFDTHISSEKFQVLQEGCQAAIGHLNSYIDFIDEYYKAVNKEQPKVQNFQEQYSTLLEKWKKVIAEYNSLLKKYEALIDEKEQVSVELINANAENTKTKSRISKFKRLLLFFSLLTILSLFLWSFNSIINWNWLTVHPKRTSLYISFQLLIIFSLLRIVTSSKAIKIIDVFIALMIAILAII